MMTLQISKLLNFQGWREKREKIEMIKFEINKRFYKFRRFSKIYKLM